MFNKVRNFLSSKNNQSDSSYEIYLKMMDMNYLDAVEFLKDKYGPAEFNYFKEKSYNKFLNGEIKSITKDKYSRTDEGLYCHHIFENQYQNLANFEFLEWQKPPFQTQLAENLVYCNLVEHTILHYLISLETKKKYGYQGLTVFLLKELKDWYIFDEKPTVQWSLNCYKASYLDKKEAKKIVKIIESEFDRI